MKRILTVLALAIVITAVVVAMSVPAFAEANHANAGVNLNDNPGGSNEVTHCNSHVSEQDPTDPFPTCRGTVVAE